MFSRYKGYKFKDFKKAMVRRIKLPLYRGDTCECPVCGAHLKLFKPIYKSFPHKLRDAGFLYPLESFETLNLAAYSCPSCDASDRERLYALYMRERLAALDPGAVTALSISRRRLRCRVCCGISNVWSIAPLIIFGLMSTIR